MELRLVFRNNEIVSAVEKWIELEIVVLKGDSCKCCRSSLKLGNYKVQEGHETEEEVLSCRRGMRERGNKKA